MRHLFAAPALAPYVVGEILPGRDVESDDALLDYLRQTGSTVFHATCTCKMGRDPLAVVDSELRVHGIEGLRVIDVEPTPLLHLASVQVHGWAFVSGSRNARANRVTIAALAARVSSNTRR